jgi:hypothetical protein
MSVWSEARRGLQIAAIAAVIYTGWVLASRQFAGRHWKPRQAVASPDAQAAFDKIYGGSEVKILQFYAPEGRVTEGGESLICYGVLNAKSVRIEPPVDGVFVALNRCVAVAPARDTRYTLTAEGNDGHTVSQSFVLTVRPDQATLPKITSFQIANHKPDYRGRTVFLLTFGAENVETVDIDPPAFPTLHGAPTGRFYVAPEKTTTYTLKVTGKHGHKTERQLTVEVP